MRARTRAMAAASFTSIALLATACGGGSDNTTPDAGVSQPAGKVGGEISIQGCTPQKGLLPGLTSETCGGNVLDAVSAKLVHYNTDTSAPENDIAESIESTDNQNFTIKLKRLLGLPRRRSPCHSARPYAHLAAKLRQSLRLGSRRSLLARLGAPLHDFVRKTVLGNPSSHR